MLLTPSRPQARDWEALEGFLQVEGGGERRQGSQGDPRALSQHSRRHRIGVEGDRPHPDRQHPAARSAERRSRSVASSARPRGRPARPRLQGWWRRVPRVCKPATRAREIAAAPLARRGPHIPARPLLPLGARSRRARADPPRARPLRVGPAGRGVQGRTEPEPDPAPPPDVTLAGVLSLPGLSFPLPKVCVRARVCVCPGAGRTGAAPTNDVTEAWASGGRWRPRGRRSG